MLPIFRRELTAFLGSLVAYMVLGLFLLMSGLLLFVFPEYDILVAGYATLDALFALAPFLFMFLIPAVTMRAIAEEWRAGTLEVLATRPASDWAIVVGKWLAAWVLVILALLPTTVYYFTISQLADAPGPDSGATLGSYFGLAMLGGVFAAIGLFASALTRNQIAAFLLAVFLCFLMYGGFDSLSTLGLLSSLGAGEQWVQNLGISAHYASISRGVVDSRDLVYFGTTTYLFLLGAKTVLSSRTW